MTEQDYRSDICRIATQLVDAANLYAQAADRVSEPDLAQCLRRAAAQRFRMGDELLSRAGISGRPADSFLPTPEEVWLNVTSLIFNSDSGAAAAARSADRALMTVVEDYLVHAKPSGSAAAAVMWLHEMLQRVIGGTSERPDLRPNQPG